MQKPLSDMKRKQVSLTTRAMMLALMASFGISAFAAPPAADRPVVDLRTRPAPETDLSKLPDNEENRLIKMGQELLTHTSEYLGPEVPDPAKRYAGNNTSCTSCHGNAGTKTYAAPLIGTYGAYPQFIPRFGKMVTLENRINMCFTRSMAGRNIPEDSTEMKALVAYIEYLSRGVPKGAKLIGEKEMFVEEPKRAANLVRGEAVYKEQCVVCHSDNGEGKRVGSVGDHKGYVFPPLWGADSTSEGASMFRLLSAYQYIYANMPFGKSTWDHPFLSKDDAYDVAGFVISHPRQPRKGEVANDVSNPYDKPEDVPWGPYVDSFSEVQHKFGPFDPIRAEDAAARDKLKKEKEAANNPASPPSAK